MLPRASLIAAALIAVLAPACALIFGIEELPTGADADDAGTADSAQDEGGERDDASDAAETSDGDSADANDADASDAHASDADAVDADDSGSQPGPCDCPATQDWSKAFVSTGDVTVAGVSVDANGHILVAGSVSGDLDVQGHILSGGASHDVFVVALDACGGHLWSRRYGDGAEQAALAIAVDSPSAPHPNAILISGSHGGTLSFGGTAPPLVAPTGSRAFVARLDPTTGDGIQAVGAGTDPLKAYRGTAIAATADGSVHWAGTEADLTGIFVRSLNPSMSVTNEVVAACTQCGPLVAPSPTGVTVAGWFQGMLDVVPGGGSVISAFGVDIFAATLVPQSAGFADTQQSAFGDGLTQRALALMTDATGNAYLAGEVAGVLHLTGNDKVTSTGGLDAFVAKFTPSLGSTWVVGFGNGTTDQKATAIALGNSVAVVGDFVGGISAGNVIPSLGGSDAFLAALDPADGSVRSLMSFGSTGDDHAAGVAIDAHGKAVVAGVLGAPGLFGCGMLGGPGKSVFVAKRAIP